MQKFYKYVKKYLVILGIIALLVFLLYEIFLTPYSYFTKSAWEIDVERNLANETMPDAWDFLDGFQITRNAQWYAKSKELGDRSGKVKILYASPKKLIFVGNNYFGSRTYLIRESDDLLYFIQDGGAGKHDKFNQKLYYKRKK